MPETIRNGKDVRPISVKQSIHEIHGLVFLSVDDFGIDLRHFHIRMAEQFRSRI